MIIMSDKQYLGQQILNQVILDQKIAATDDRQVGLNDKMELVKLHYIDCTDGIDSCNICEMVNKLMEDYTCPEIMDGVEVD